MSSLVVLSKKMDFSHENFSNRKGHIVSSAPGKVLVCGGYVVLNGFASLVLTTRARFYSVVGSTSSVPPHHIRVESPQFGKIYNYDFKGASLSRTSDTSENPYVEKTLSYTLQLLNAFTENQLSQLDTQGLRITIFADNDFYSQKQTVLDRGMPLGSSSLAKLERYLPLNPANIAKTGLGSSAALVSALSSSLFSWGLNIAELQNLKPHLELVHNLAQLAHCHAQGKIGSGFDISSAFFGSQLYRRFDAASLAAIMETASDLSPSHLREKLSAIKVGFGGSVALPPGLKLVLGESGKDMHTPTSVKKVLDWLAASQETGRKHFEDLDAANRSIIDLLLELHRLHALDEAQYNAARHEVCKWSSDSDWTLTSSTTDSTKDKCLSIFRSLRQTFQKIRQLLKLMGDLAGTAIEPEEVTSVLNGTLQKVPGAVFAGAPGAGGYDAIFAVLVDDSQGQRGQLESFWLANQELPICPLLTEEDGHGIKLQTV